MRIQELQDQQVLGAALIVLGVSLGGAAAVAGVLAFDHMAWALEMCGPTTGHCLRCVAAAALSIAALGTSGAGIRLMRLLPTLQRAG